MNCIDIFNGDADGICSLHQLRLEKPQPDAQLISGVKRDISLVQQIGTVQNSTITILDISLDKNRESVGNLLGHNNTILYVDHHYAGEVPFAESEQLTIHINPEPQLCTSLIVNWLLEDKYAAWAVVGAFGDNLDESAQELAQRLGLKNLDQLRELGILLNYNGYGAALDDLFFHPAELYRQVSPYADPLSFYTDSAALKTLQEGYEDDMARAKSSQPLYENSTGRIFRLPSAAWARRVSGVFANAVANERPDLAHAMLTENRDGSLLVSVRAPLQNRNGADSLCRQFVGGGGRAAAAGINALPEEQVDAFIQAFCHQFGE
jgi:hypothetical protein